MDSWKGTPTWRVSRFHDGMRADMRAALTAAFALVTPGAGFQARVHPWMMACFGAEIAADKLEQLDRFLEEVLELCQAQDYPEWRIDAIKRYTFDRPQGDVNQELGGVMVTLAALCLANDLDMHAAGEIELARVSTPEMIAKIRAKQAAKPKFSPLPVGELAALPEGGDGWLPIETHPGDTKSCLIAGKYPNGVAYAEDGFRHHDGHWNSRRLEPPTHWQPMPSPPAISPPLCDDAGGGT